MMIRSHDDPEALTLDVAGPATMKESPTVKAAARKEVACGRPVRLDLRDCTVIDSTFSGTLLAMKRQLERSGGSLTLVSPSATVLALLERMGLENSYPIDNAERAEGEWDEVAEKGPSAAELVKAVREAHDELARSPAADLFRSVAAELNRRDPRD